MSESGLQLRAVDLENEGDARALVELLDHYARDPMGGGAPLASAVRASLVNRLRGEVGYHAAIAWRAGEPVGLINCFQGFSTFAARPLLNVHDLVVRDGFRGRGIGRSLLAWAEARACELGCCKLTLEVLSGNAGAIRSYAGAGFRPYQLDPLAGEALLLQKQL